MSNSRLNGISISRIYSVTVIILVLAIHSTSLSTRPISRVQLPRIAILSGTSFTTRSRACVLKLADEYQNNENEKLGGSASTRNLFFLTEIFGKITSLFRDNSDDGSIKLSAIEQQVGSSNVESTVLTSPRTVEDIEKIAAQIKKEYEAIFWATGNMDTSLWASDCTFADPFSSFGGEGSTKRFKKNADNLGKLVLNPVLKITSYKIDYHNKIKTIENIAEVEVEVVVKDENVVKLDNKINRSYDCVRVGWIFSSKLNLPWKPILAAAGETFHYLDSSTGLIIRYEETWKSKPWDVVKRVFTPTRSASSSS